PAVAEFMDDLSIKAAEKYLGRPLPHSAEAGAFVLFSLEGESIEELENAMIRLDELSRGLGAPEVLAAFDEGQQDRLWESRRILGKAMKTEGGEVGKADVVVPKGEIPLLVRKIKDISAEFSIDIACFGHAGDGNVHVNVLRRGLGQEEWEKTIEAVMAKIMEAVAALGGRPSGEHGIGCLKTREMATFVGERAVELMRGVKKVFDPKGILNPGKVI
ncbi:FAD-binding oxidoreductase, partial [bacterium]